MAGLNDRSVGKVLDILDKVWVEGVVSILTDHLLNIYGKERVTKGMWRDITERWQRLMEDKGYDIPPELLIGYESGYHLVSFAFGDEIDPVSKKRTPYLKPSSAFLGEPSAEGGVDAPQEDDVHAT